MAVFANSAGAAVQVQTLEAVDVGPHSVTLQGKIFREGQSAVAGFEYGDTTAYGSESDITTVPIGSGWYYVSSVITGLKPAKTYHFRFGAYAEKYYFGEDATVTTPYPIFTAARYPAELKGVGLIADPPVIGLENGDFTCTTTTVTGKKNLATASVTLTPSFSGCAMLGVNATVTTNGCNYVVTASYGISDSVSIDCPGGKALEVTAGTCAIAIPSQTALANVEAGVFTQNGNPSMWRLRLDVSGIDYTKTKDGTFCKFNGTGSREDGTYLGTIDIAGTYVDDLGGEEAISLGFDFSP